LMLRICTLSPPAANHHRTFGVARYSC
jgi:hypothetical protein